MLMYSKIIYGRLLFVFAVLVATASMADAAIQIVVAEKLRDDAGLKLATDDLVEALKKTSKEEVSVIYRPRNGSLPAGDTIFIGRSNATGDDSWQGATAESFRIRPLTMQGHNAVAVEGKAPGLMYATFKLAERIRLGSKLWRISLESTPAFPLRMFSEEGQLLDIPDIGYYSDKAPYVNKQRLQEEVDELKRLVDQIVKLGYNTLTVLHVNFEDYIDYRHLDKPIYLEGDRHLLRSPVFCKYLTQLADYAHKRHVQLYLQPYEFQYPSRLDELYGVNIDSPNFEKIVTAKVRELFERVPLDGLVITATETYPRCGYQAKKIWLPRDLAGAGRMATFYHNAAEAMNKKIFFRMWRVAWTEARARTLSRQVGGRVPLATKNTGADYFLNWPTTDIITGGLPKEQPMMVLFDTFREYDGWSRLFIYMKRRGEVMQSCRDNGVVAINGWGAWSPSCIDSDDGGRVSNIGTYDIFRMLTRGFTPGQANVYLLGRLAWDADADVNEVARDFASLHLGQSNGPAAAEALLETEAAFAEEYVGTRQQFTHPCYLKWTMWFRPNKEQMEKAYGGVSLDRILTKTARALEHVRRMEAAFARTDASKAPDAKRYAQFKEGVEKTALYLRTLYLWRQCWWRQRTDQDLKGEAKAANMEALRADKAKLMLLFEQWSRWPAEARHWRITSCYGPAGGPTMENTAGAF